MTPPRSSSSASRVLLLGVALILAISAAFGQSTPMLIPFQGRLTDQQGQVRSNGTYTLIFNLYDQAVGGSNLWTERHERVGVVNGMVNVFLGSITPLDNPAPGVDFSVTRHLGITVDADNNSNTADPEMVPRQMIIPAFWAKKADDSRLLAGADWRSILVSGNNPDASFIKGIKVEPSGISSVQLAENSVSRRHIQSGAVVATNIAEQSITYPKLARRRPVAGKGTEPGDIAMSSTIGHEVSASLEWQTLTGSSISLVTSGGPVMISVVNVEAPSDSNEPNIAYAFSILSRGTGIVNIQLGVFVDGRPVTSNYIRTELMSSTDPRALISIPFSLNCLLTDLPPGSHSFDLRIRTVNSDATQNIVGLIGMRLIAYEP